MRINSALLLILGLLLVIAPTLDSWLNDGSRAWYRYHLLWLAAIVAVYANSRRSPRNGH